MSNKPSIIHCRHCGNPLVAHTVICPYCGEKTGQRAQKEHPRFQVSVLKRNIPIPVVSLVLLCLNVICGIVKLLNGGQAFLMQYGMISGALQRGEWQRLILSNFLHANLLHLVSNMYPLMVYGFLLENRIGRLRYLLIYLASMAGSTLLINFIGGAYAIHMGASGAVFGLMTADLVYCLKTHKKFFHTLYSMHAVAGNVLYTVLTPGISWQGHLGGALAGVLVSLLLIRGEQGRT